MLPDFSLCGYLILLVNLGKVMTNEFYINDMVNIIDITIRRVFIFAYFKNSTFFDTLILISV